MTLTKICKTIEKKSGIKGKYAIGAHNLHYLEYSLENHSEFSAVLSAINLKYVKVFYSNVTTGCIRIAERLEYERFESWNNARNALIEGFWQAYHSGGKSAANAYYIENISKYREYGIE